MTGVEVWLTGSRTELAAAVAALAAAGRLTYAGTPSPLSGADAGRCRQYLRLNVTTARAAARTCDRAAAPVLDFAA